MSVSELTRAAGNERKRVTTFLLLGVLWALAVCSGMAWLERYSLTAGPVRPAVLHWPATVLAPVSGPSLVMVLHPYCPCSEASLEELARILAHSHGPLNVRLLFYRPIDQPASWVHTGLWNTALNMRGVQVAEDMDGAAARQFGLATSGEAAVYDAHGTLVFRGGITPSRGHAGDNYGADAVEQFVNKGLCPRTRTPVFGCSVLSGNPARQFAGIRIQQ